MKRMDSQKDSSQKFEERTFNLKILSNMNSLTLAPRNCPMWGRKMSTRRLSGLGRAIGRGVS